MACDDRDTPELPATCCCGDNGGIARADPIPHFSAMYSRLPSTYELLEALAAVPAPAPVPASASAVGATPWPQRAGRAFWLGFVVTLVATLIAAAGLVVWRLVLKHPLAPWSIRLTEALLVLSAACYAASGLMRLPGVLAILRNPLRWQAVQMDLDSAIENALLRRLGRIHPLQLQARQRRVALQLRLWEGMARTVGLLLALAPAALVLVSGLHPLPHQAQMKGSLLWLYAVMVVVGAAFYLYVHVQCSRPLRRLSHVLAEAAEINARLGAKRAGPAPSTEPAPAQ
ncbi:hypothetical protein [Cupriavidus pinatubonensis]|uniref:Transmembrane protein n=1 Tax=Cupriavidus pinatubonensis TaxID=248026 RepID=A0ABM8WSS4_9BURK|nr:hypothetical protein [Cupriavidus pinatubonensis]CAG9170518.1 hypothetical protein LMG23994_01931 [Cupriavidus pinatubonensis]